MNTRPVKHSYTCITPGKGAPSSTDTARRPAIPGVNRGGILGRDVPVSGIPGSAAKGMPPGATRAGILGRTVPAIGTLVADARKSNEPLTPNPPPETKPQNNMLIVSKKDESTDCEIRGDLLDDDTDGSLGQGAHTAFTFTTSCDTPHVEGYENGKIVKIEGKATYKVTFTLRTSYGGGGNRKLTSSYGRGTTKEDKKHGNVTLGFHESCHRNDYLAMLKAMKLPTFHLKVGMPMKKFAVADKAFRNACEKIGKAIDGFEARSIAKTDEVGFKKSQFEAKQKKK